MSKKYYGVIGHPIGHTLSPFIHTRLMALSGIDGEYGVYDIDINELDKKFADTLSKLNGFNVTIPHKQAIMRLLDETDETAKLYGSVNTVAFVQNDNGSTCSKGYTTDGIGFVTALENAGMSFGSAATVIGCGGVGRVFANTCAVRNCKVNLLVRESAFERTELFAESLNKRFGEGTAKVFFIGKFEGESDLLINASPVGMYPKTDYCPVSEDIISKSKSVFDAVYNPADTMLVKKARDMGIKAISGMTMLVYQAAAAQTIWNGSVFSSEDIDKLAEDCFKELNNR